MTNEDAVNLASLMRKIDLDDDNGVSASDMEELEKGLARIDSADFILLNIVTNSLEGKPFILTSDNRKTIERCRSLAEHIGASFEETSDDNGFRVVVGVPKARISTAYKRFVLEADGSILDGLNRITPASVCNCDECNKRGLSGINEQVYLRRCVLRAQLDVLSQQCESLCEPEAHSLAEVIYWTIYVSQLDWTIGQTGAMPPNAASIPTQYDLPDISYISGFLDQVSMMLRDLYGDCDQHLLNDLLGAISVIAFQWERARTTSSRDFIERCSEILDATLAPGDPTSARAVPFPEAIASNSIGEER